MQSDEVEETLVRHAAHPNFRGIRDFAVGDYLVDPAFHRGYALLEKFNMSYDLDATPENMSKARDLAVKFPGIDLILGHAGFPQERTDEYFGFWMAGMRSMAEAPNTACKISGLGMVDQRWTVESLRPWVLGCIEAFGVDRCMFATNWPVDRLFSSYGDVVAAYREIVAELNDEEQRKLFVDNAWRWYRFA
jgi:predicted TIM-barrel fold metal-dependent hydrolase